MSVCLSSCAWLPIHTQQEISSPPRLYALCARPLSASSVQPSTQAQASRIMQGVW